jgi:hypothetical protein
MKGAAMRTADYEKLGIFYLGREVDPETLETSVTPLLYDSRDLVTHAAIVGMTGSGKTGLGIALLEEAAIDGIPALVIDPKGDLSNLLLTFPELRAEDFLPWVRAEDAARKGTSREDLAAATAERWRSGLAAWGQDGERIRRLRAAAEVAVYTPGSSIARPLSILASFAAPPPALRADADLFRDRVETAATSLLALVGIDADPLRSREHILISTLLAEAWSTGRDYDLAGLIADAQNPPVARVGMLDVETFFPANDRFALALRINNLLAAPGFDAWMRGEPLALDRLLYGDDGRPRLAVVSLAHLGDAERMFLVSLLLSETIAWMRAQSGTSSLRAMLYMDEVFGYLPPVANPPSKKPMLTLLKQARAYGLGVVLATQNPVDLDYKALSNIGTWFLGRLQTERDKARVLDGLEGASAAARETFDRGTVDRLLSSLRQRVFLLHNVHASAPTLFETRWVMSYLAGPLDREQLRGLAGARGASASADRLAGRAPSEGFDAPDAAAQERPTAPARAIGNALDGSAAPPVLAPGIVQRFLPCDEGSSPFVYRPALLGVGRAFVEDARRGVSERIEVGLLASFDEAGSVDWLAAEAAGVDEGALAERPDEGARFAPLPARAQKTSSYTKWRNDFAAAVTRTATVEILRSPTLRESSRPGEGEREFRIRLTDLAHQRRDGELEKIRKRYAPRLASLDDRLRRAGARVEAEKQQADAQKMSTILAGAASIAGVLFGRSKVSATNVTRVGTAVRAYGRTSKKAGDVERAKENVAALLEQRAALEEEIEGALAAVATRYDLASEELERITVKPRKSDVEVRLVALAWVPAVVD